MRERERQRERERREEGGEGAKAMEAGEEGGGGDGSEMWLRYAASGATGKKLLTLKPVAWKIIMMCCLQRWNCISR